MSACCAQAQRSLEASSQVHRRLMQRSTVAPHGGWGGRRQDRRFLYSRYRSLQPSILLKALPCAWLHNTWMSCNRSGCLPGCS